MMMSPSHCRRAAISTLLVSLAFLALTSCGGGGGSGGEPPPGACGEGAASGETVVCSVAGMNFSCDCTVFFGTTPVEAACDEADQTITFTVPPSAPGPKNVSSQCGDDAPKTIQEGFSVQPPAPQPISCEDNSDCPGGQVCQEGVCTNPANPGGSAPEPPSENPPPPPPPEAPPAPPPEAPPPPECTVDADCTGGKVCQGGSCVPPPPPPPLEVSFETGAGKTEALHGAKLGLVRIKWKITGGGTLQKAYIYGPSNRLLGTEDCEMEGTRYLAVTTSGNQIAEGTGAYTTYQKYLTGEKCDVATGNCHGFEPVEGDPTICKIDLMGLGVGGTFFTRFLKMNSAETAEFVIVAQSWEGIWKTDRQVFGVPKPTLTNPIPIVEINGDSPTVHVQFGYSNAWQVSLGGCDSATPLNWPATVPDDAGAILTSSSGTLNFTSCKLKENLTFTMIARGIGLGSNEKQETFKVKCDDPQLTFTQGDYYKNPTGNTIEILDHAGYIQLTGKAWLSCTVKKKNAGGSFVALAGYPKNVPWVKELRLSGHNPSGATWSSCPSSGWVNRDDQIVDIIEGGTKAKITKRITRSHTCTNYKFSVKGIDNVEKSAPIKSIPYDAEFDLSNGHWSGSYGCSIDDCDVWGEGDCCDGDCESCGSDDVSDCHSHQTTLSFNWDGRHLKEVKDNCGGTFNGGQPSVGEYDHQQGSWTKTVSGTSITGCTITGVRYDGNEINWHPNPVTWGDNC